MIRFGAVVKATAVIAAKTFSNGRVPPGLFSQSS